MLRMLAAATVATLGLVGCSLGISPGGDSPSADYTIDVNYQDAYKMAQAQAKQCLVGQDAYSVKADMDTVARKAVVRVRAPFTDNDIARVDIAAKSATQSDVRIAMWGRSVWNDQAIVAMRDAIRFGIPACTSYMPARDEEKKTP
jgi:hypothetical protein